MKFAKILAALSIGALTAGCAAGDGGSQGETAQNDTAQTLVTDVDALAAQKLVASDESIVVLDVRTPREYAEGHIEGATNADFKSDDFEQRLSKLDPAAHYLIHCKSGGRSSGALEVMQKLGFERVSHLNNGFDAWQDAELPVAVSDS